MTAVLAIESGMLEDKIIVSDEILKAYGSNVYLSVGEEIYLKDLVYALMLISGNDASLAISTSVTETTEDFVAYEAIKVNNAEKVLGEDGWIKVYDTETNSLIAMITKEKFDQEFYFDVLAKNIKIETSEVISVDMPLYVSCIKSLDVKKVIEKYTEDDFK